jgi:hypothetical protein
MSSAFATWATMPSTFQTAMIDALMNEKITPQAKNRLKLSKTTLRHP